MGKSKPSKSNHPKNPNHSNENQPKDHSKYKEFQERISYLDDFSSESELSKSTFNGLFNFIVTLGLIKFVFTSWVNYKKTGSFIELEIYNTVKRDYLYAVSVWPLFYLYSHM